MLRELDPPARQTTAQRKRELRIAQLREELQEAERNHSRSLKKWVKAGNELAIHGEKYDEIKRKLDALLS